MTVNLTYISQEKCIINHIVGILLFFPTQNILSLWCQRKAKIHFSSSPGTKSVFINLKYIKVSLIKNTKLAHSFEKEDSAVLRRLADFKVPDNVQACQMLKIKDRETTMWTLLHV